ncbi:DUF2691 family protein [Bacillus pseudomycoides]|uniref:DUF2691 family protein n=1 Tax=Bacillus pseudomycoides TaxID=64104 RepID=UPI000BF7943B|nr:DUF2691 family protein [Bacillus pseudomycoides]PEP77217.1 hypothetical protein CN584_25955 [Bacillus pseudomycoides]
MNIGINFFAPQDAKFDISILNLLETFNFQNYLWQINDADVLIKDSSCNITDESLFENKRFITGNKLEHILRTKDFYLIFFTICAFSNKKKSIPTRLLTMTDFINSDCKFLLSVVDGLDISILCKDEGLLKKLYQRVQDLGYLNTEYLTESYSGKF